MSTPEAAAPPQGDPRGSTHTSAEESAADAGKTVQQIDGRTGKDSSEAKAGTEAAATAGATRSPSAAKALRELGANLRAAAAIAALRSRSLGQLRASGLQLALLALVHMGLGFAYDLYSAGWDAGQFDLMALPDASFWALAALFSAWLLAALRSDSSLVLPLACAGFGLACWESVAASLLAVAADTVPAIDRSYLALSWLPPAWTALAYGLAAMRLCAPASRSGRAAAFLLSGLLVLAPQAAIDPASRLWTGEPGADPASAGGPDGAQSEQTLYRQYDLLDDALDAVAPGQEGVTELFTISFGGDGSQDVFVNEASGADLVLADVFDSGPHSLVLANSVARPQERPFATVSSLQRALATMADRMNGDEDVLALFLTSHGSPDHHLAVSLPPYQFEDLTPERLRALLDEAGIRFRVIIVSSCYAGGFVAPLSGPDTMVIAASAADRASFGCRDGAQWTDFGRAYFAEALARSASFEGAFRIASRAIAEREAQEGLSPSQPQISVGEGIRRQLQRLETRRGGRILFAARSSAGTHP